MQKNFYFEYGDEDAQFTEVCPERSLYLAVFASAVTDLFNGKGVIRRRAVEWFNGEGASIAFHEIKSMFDFNSKRNKKLLEYINGECKKRIIFKKRYYHRSEYHKENRLFGR